MSGNKKKKVEPWLRVRVPSELLPLPREGFLICSGVGLKPWRRCHWQGLVVYHTERTAKVAYNTYNMEGGQAMLDLSNPRLCVFDEDGEALNVQA